MKISKWILLISVMFAGLLVSDCIASKDGESYLLYGLTINDTAPNTCASEIAVTTTQIELAEDGDVTRTYSLTDPYFSDSDADGAPAWGFRSVETCVYLNNAFTGRVEIPITTNSTYAGRLDVKTSYPSVAALPSKLSFTSSGVASRQCFSVTRINDASQNPRESAFQLQLGAITSADDEKLYAGKNPCDISVTMEDDEAPGVRVSNISNVMEEPGGGSGFTSGTYTVRLRTAPSANVTVPINALYDSKNAGYREGTVDKSSLLFTPANYNVSQTVTVTSVDDMEIDGTVQYTIQMQNAVSSDTTYNGLDPRDVVIINQDQSIPGYVYTRFDATGGQTNKGTGATVQGFATDQKNNMGSTYSSFKLHLRAKPTASVTINFATDMSAISNILTPSLTFTTSNWNVDQWVYVTGKSNGTDSATGNGNIDFTVSFGSVVTGDPSYNSAVTVARPTFIMRSCDNDNTHVIQPCNFSGSPYGDTRGRLTGAEPSTTNYIWLITKDSPGGAVTVALTSDDLSEGSHPGTFTIDSTNFNKLETGTNKVILTYVDDAILDDNQNWTAVSATSGGSLSYDSYDIYATTTDNEVRYTITKTGNTNEDEITTATVKIYLAADNATDVSMTVGCTDATECLSVNPTSISWTANQLGLTYEKTIIVTGKNDPYADGDINFNVTFTVDSGSNAVFYPGHDPASQSITNVDNEPAGKAIYITTGSYQGEMSGIGLGGDLLCNSSGLKPAYLPSGTYKALMVSNGATDKRIATTDGSTIAGQTGWILTSTYMYYMCSGSGAANCSDEFKHIFTANSANLIPAGAMSRDFSAADTFWTGMNANMTAATQPSTPAKFFDDPDYRDNCAGWTYNDAPNKPPTHNYYGQTWTSSGGTISSQTDNLCTLTRKLICVQQ